MRAPRRAKLHPRRVFEAAASRATFALWLALVSVTACAQISGTVSLVTNYRFRGVSLSENKPAAQLGIAYDDALGWYAGAFASTVDFATPVGHQLQAIPFVGYAWRSATGVSWEFGGDYSAFTGNASDYNYPEAYFGVAADNVGARLYYAPRYFGLNSAAVYGEVNASQPLLDRVRLLAHVGVLWNTNANPYYGQPEHLFDGRVGVGVDLEQFNVQLSWIGISSASAAYGITNVRSRNGLVLTLLRSF